MTSNSFYDLNGIYFNPTSQSSPSVDLDAKYLVKKSGGTISNNLVVIGDIKCDSLVVDGEVLTGIASALTNETIRATNAENTIKNSIETYESGEIVKTSVIYRSAFRAFNNVINNKGSWQTHCICNYVAKGDNMLYITYNLNEYNLSGLGDDSIQAKMVVSSSGSATSESYRTRQNYRSGAGGGTRSGCIFPLSHNYSLITSQRVKTVDISIQVYLTGDDTWSCDANSAAAHIHISEYAR
jgi:hypothetical protein